MTKLTDHEMEVLSYLSMGLDQHETAKRMHTSYKALNQAVQSITKKHKGLQRAIDWYIAQDWAGHAVDELPEPDEPTGPVTRCQTCQGLLDGPGLPRTEHRCPRSEDYMYRQHGGYANRGMTGPGNLDLHRDSGFMALPELPRTPTTRKG